ncbi:MAG: KpsF/GutQ family sugar-phosphate isomerase [Bacteroidales bacterium]|nr:KpsF/GutQ family sugar-phosphate isomerase [Bacteroidales bacterium]
MKYFEQFNSVINIEINELIKLKNRNQPDLQYIIDQLIGFKDKLIITGMGKSGIIGMKMAATFASLGTPSFFLHPAEAYHGDLGMIGKEDAVLAISNSGETEEILKLIPFIKSNGNVLISLTGNSKSTLAVNSNYHIDVSVEQEACPHQLAPSSSTTNALVVGDALAITLSQLRNFQPENFAQFHPGGSLGKKLLSTVADFMKKENLPVCTLDAKLIDVIQVISEGKAGLAVVMDSQKIKGIITDGDIRRAMEKNQHAFFQMKASDIKTENPKTISPAEKLHVAERIFSENKITTLLVARESQLEGIIQIYDL